jgi:hypothetical protein
MRFSFRELVCVTIFTVTVEKIDIIGNREVNVLPRNKAGNSRGETLSEYCYVDHS